MSALITLIKYVIIDKAISNVVNNITNNFNNINDNGYITGNDIINNPHRFPVNVEVPIYKINSNRSYVGVMSVGDYLIVNQAYVKSIAMYPQLPDPNTGIVAEVIIYLKEHNYVIINYLTKYDSVYLI